MRKNKPLILAMAVVLAVVTVLAAGTFAWFTAQDSVDNHLETSKLTDGDVTIIETFDPEDQLEPGVAVNKQVGAINTGDTNALVRMSFEELLTKLTSGEQIRTIVCYNEIMLPTPMSYTYEIPQLININSYSTANGWNVLTDTSISMDAESKTALNKLTNYGVTVVYKTTSTNPVKYSFAAYSELYTVPNSYQRVEILPEAFNMVEGNLVISLVSPDEQTCYFNYISLEVEEGEAVKWANFASSAILQNLPDNSRTFTALTSEPSVNLNPNIATPSLSSEYIQLIFGTNVKTNLTACVDGDWYYNAADGWFYYMGTLKSGETTSNLLEKVYMMQDTGNDYSYTKFDLTVKMDAIQAIKDAVTSASGWNLSGALATKLQTYTR